jgi:3-phosphoshikimate 1-carboxyvinyltransferase
MQISVQPATLNGGEITVPGDKSISHRAVMFAGIAEGQSRISGFLNGEDCLSTLAALQALGVRIDVESASTLLVHGVGIGGLLESSTTLDMGNSGTAMRLFSGVLSGQKFSSRLSGDESLSRRPMGRVIRPLETMGARITAQNNFPPLTIHGGRTLSAIDYAMPVASAQVKSAILLAGLFANGKTTVTEPAVTRDHTERMLDSMGVKIDRTAGFVGVQGGQVLHAANIEVPADLSSAAFLILGALVSSDAELLIIGVGVNPTRTGVIDVLLQMGGSIEIENPRLMGREPVADLRITASKLQGIDVDPAIVSLAIDEFPVLFVAGALAKGITRFSGLGELRVKESDRIAAMTVGLRTLGINVTETPDGAVVEGGRLTGGIVDSFGDHRIAMSFAVAGTVAESPVIILNTSAVDTSFPGFVDSLRSLGANIESRPDGSP